LLLASRPWLHHTTVSLGRRSFAGTNWIIFNDILEQMFLIYTNVSFSTTPSHDIHTSLAMAHVMVV
jgi:hypothetical protein